MRGGNEWAALPWSEVQERLGPRSVALLPTGSTEAHGPHLPLATDEIISREMCVRAAKLLREEHGVSALVLPSVAYAVTDFSADFPGTITISAQTATALLTEVTTAALGAGVGAVVYANAHLEPGHLKTLYDAVSAVSERYPGRVGFPDKTRKPWALELGEEFRSGACHAGEYEGSLVLAARPEWVREDVARTLEDNPISLSRAIRAGQKTFREIGGEQAYFGFPSRASREKGEELYAVLVRMLAECALEML